MLKIEINNTTIPYDPATKLPVVLKNGFFVEDNMLPGSYIFNTSFPASDELKQIFGFAHKVAKSGRATAELPYLIQEGALKYTGTCIVQEADEDSYEIAFKVNSGEFASQIKDKTLKDLDWGDDIAITNCLSMIIKEGEFTRERFIDPQDETEYIDYVLIDWTEAIDISNQFSSSIPYAFIPLNNGSYKFSFSMAGKFSGSWAKLIIRIGNTDHEYDILTEAHHQKTPFSLSVDEIFTIAAGTICKIFICAKSDYYRFIPTGNYMNGYIIEVENGFYQYSTPSIFESNKSNNQSTTDWCVFPYQNSKFFDSFPDDGFMLDNISIKTIYSEYFKVLNYYKNNEFPLLLLGTVEDESIIAANLFTPNVFMNTILKKIVSESGFELVNNPFEDPDFENMVLMHQFCENLYTNGIASIIPVKESFNLKDHVPELKQNEFVRYISILTGYFPIVNINAKTVTFVDIKDRHIITEENSQPFDGVILKGKTVTVKPEYSGISFKIEKASQDANLDRIKEITDEFSYKGEVLQQDYLPADNNNPGDVYLITALQEYWAWQYNTETFMMGWSFLSVNWPLEYKEGEDPFLNFSTNLCPVLPIYYKDDTPGADANRWWIIPIMETPGIFEGFPDSYNNESGLQVAYFGGMRTDSNGNDYPVASSNHLNLGVGVDKQDINAKSIYENRYKGYVDWIVNHAKPVKIYAVMTSLQAHNLNLSKIQITPDFNFIIKEARFNILSDGLSVAELDIYTV